MDACFVLADVPRSQLVASSPAPGAQENGITRGNLDARLLFPGFEIFLEHWRTRFEVRQPLKSRDVHQNSASDDATLEQVDAELRATLCRVHIGVSVTVVRPVLVDEVTQCVDVAVRV